VNNFLKAPQNQMLVSTAKSALCVDLWIA